VKPNNRIKRVAFIDIATFKAYQKLKRGTFEEKRLAEYIDRAIEDLKKDPLVGVAIPRDLWPKEYIKKYRINNLRKYDLPSGWRLIYTLVGNEVEIISIILEWLNHDSYERRFGYKKR
jgi:Txe/YoeB family toxin of Txe-Axe toxin-antitoxin module